MRFQMDLRGDWSSVCPALLRNPRRNQVAPKYFLFDPVRGAKFIASRAWQKALSHTGSHGVIQEVCVRIAQRLIEKPEYFGRMCEHGVGAPGPGVFVLTKIAPACGNDRHACGTRALHVAQVVSNI